MAEIRYSKMVLPKLNTKLLPFKIHYFLKNGGASFMSFLAPMAIQRRISPKGVGIIWTLNPLVSAVFNIVSGTLADKTKSHRALLFATCTILAVSFTTYFFLPAVPEIAIPAIKTSVLVVCGQNVSSLILCPTEANLNLAPNVTFPSCGPIESYGNNTLDKRELVCNSTSQVENSINFIFNPHNICEEGKCLNVSENDRALFYSNFGERRCGTILNLECENICGDSRGSETASLTDSVQTGAFWLHVFCVILIYVGIDSSSSLADTMCFVVLGKDRNKYGQQRMFGALGWGLMGALMGALVNLVSKDQPETNYTPALVITATLLFTNLLVTSRINVKVPGRQVKGEVRSTLFSFSCICLLLTALVMGTTMGLIWTFGFIYIREVSLAWDPNFSDANLLQGIIVFTDCFLGELPCMFLSAYIIKKLHNIKTFAMTLIVTSIRILLMSIITNPWLFICAHALHGPSFGVFIPNMISYANHLAPQGSQATILSFTMASFAAGRSLGALLGGLLMESLGGSNTFLTMGLIVSFYTIVFIFVNWLYLRMRRKTSEDDTPETPKKSTEADTSQKDEENIDDESCEKDAMMKAEDTNG